MSDPRDATRLSEMIDAAENIGRWIQAAPGDDFAGDPKLRAAVSMQLIVLGEGARQLTPDARALAPDVPWEDMAALSRRLVHRGAQASPGIVSESARNRVPAVLPELRRVLAALSPGSV